LASRDFNPVAREQLLGLVFVKVHFSQSPNGGRNGYGQAVEESSGLSSK
jgi:hypothetical protein